MDHVTAVRGIPGYELLAGLRLHSGQLMWRIVGVSTLLHSILGGVFFGVAPGSIAGGFVGSWQIFSLAIYYGVTTGVFVFLTLNGGRWLHVKMIRPLLTIDADIEAQSHHFEPKPGYFFAIVAVTALSAAWITRMLLLGITGLDIFAFETMLSQGSGVVFVFFVAMPIQMVAVGIGMATGVFSATRYTRAVARSIRLDILRIDDYACMTIVPVTIFCTACLLLSLALLLSLTADSIVFRDLMFTVAASFIVIGVVLSGYASVPVVLLARRLRNGINDEISWVLAVIDGTDPDALHDGRLPLLRQPDNVELVMYLNALRGMSPWPIGTQVRTVLIFGLLPPVTWFMAASVENLVY